MTQIGYFYNFLVELVEHCLSFSSKPKTFPEIFGEDKFVVMLGGLHFEMALWSTMGDLLRGYGWPETLNEAGLVMT